MTIEKNYLEILRRIDSAKRKSNRSDEITLVAVTKTYEAPQMIEAIELGIKNIAENRVQEIQRKYSQIPQELDVCWHQIGSLQTNKVKYIIDKVELIHSLDRYELAKEIDRQAKKIDKVQKCLVQVKVSEEESKKGASTEEVIELIQQIQSEFENIQLCGLMAMAPYFDEPEDSRKYFVELKQLFDEIKQKEIVSEEFVHLSMGMSNDYFVAVEEGATMVRIGSALFATD